MTNWISVSKELPDENMPCAIYLYSPEFDLGGTILPELKCYSFALFIDGEFHHDSNHPDAELTHWMPLPEPPE